MTIDPARLRLVAFDLDDTLADSKSPMTPEMAQALSRLLDHLLVGIISGGRLQQFEAQVLRCLPPGAKLDNLHLMPTCGTRYLRFTPSGWHEVYNQDLTEEEKAQAIASLTRRAQEVGAWEPDDKVTGPRIEDRGSQITYSALGQQATPEVKRAWDADGSKRHALRDAVAADLPGLAVAAGGSTSIDITRRGVDKAYGIQMLSRETGIPLSEMIFIGDRTEPGGNDYPVVCLGVTTVPVKSWRDTVDVVTGLCDRLDGKQ